MNKQEQLWAGNFGDQYTKRCRVDWWARTSFWARVIAQTRPREAVEFGCNAGWNLMAVRALGWKIKLRGVEINPVAAHLAREAGFEIGNLEPADLIFTVGVLIHIAPENIEATMQAIAERARRHVVAVEYEHSFEQAVEYRGERDQLWKRPYGGMYQKHGLTLIEQWQADEAFDNGRCTAWLLEKR